MVKSNELLSRRLWLLLVVYFVASVAHFTHNAEYIAFYPNMPTWLTREQVYVVWAAITGVGAIGLLLKAGGWKVAGTIFIAAYGLLGLDGLGHYALALCSEHTLAMNATIWFEVVAGVLLASVCLVGVLRAGGPVRHQA